MTTEIYVKDRYFPSRYAELLTEDAGSEVVIRTNPNTFPWHEAGHAVIGLAEGVQIKFAEVYDDWRVTKIGGLVKRANRNQPLSTIFYAAGERAADRWLREAGLWTPRTAVSVEVNAHVDRLHYDFRTDHDAADEALDKHWNAVIAVAEALARLRKLSGEVITEIAKLEWGNL